MFDTEFNFNVDMIVAIDPNYVMGKDNSIPWHCPEDLKWFKEVTSNSIVIMGRKTWESLPKPYLPNRFNVVLTRNPEEMFEKLEEGDFHPNHGPFFVSDIDDVEHICRDVVGPDVPRIVIGGSHIYKLFLDKNLVRNMYITKMIKEYEGDTFFPKLDPFSWIWLNIRNEDDFDIYKVIKTQERKPNG